MASRQSNPTKKQKVPSQILGLIWLFIGCNAIESEKRPENTRPQLAQWRLSLNTTQKQDWELSGKEVLSQNPRVYLKDLLVKELNSGFALKSSHAIWEIPHEQLTLHHADLTERTTSLRAPLSSLKIKEKQWEGGDFVLKGLHWQLTGKAFQASVPLKTWTATGVHATFKLD